ncbi:MAG: TonB-dependent receptor [Myxococcota bacterium]
MRTRTPVVLLWSICLLAPQTVLAQTDYEDESDYSADDAQFEPTAPDPSSYSISPDTPPTEDEEVERIAVTGSRIKRKNLAGAAPVTVLDREDLLSSGMTSVGEILQLIPANANAINVQFNNGGNGTATVNLRSLGATRTLVLVNGRRHVPGGNGANAAVDLNSIPVSIIKRVEVLKDGASSVYGSDAVAGVVNIITRDDYEGFEANAYTGLSQRNDGNVYQLDLTTGMSGSDGNVVATVTFFDQQPVFAGERRFSRIARGFDWDAWEAAGQPDVGRFNQDFVFASGSSGTPQGTIVDGTGAAGNAAWDATGCGGGGCFNDPVNGWRPFVDPDDLYNFQPENYLVTPNRRFNFFTQGNYEFSNYVRSFFELSYTDRRSAQLLAPNPLFTITEGITVSSENRFNPFGRDFTDVRRRLLEVGNRVFRQNSSTSRIVVGFDGDIPDIPGILEDWTWELSANFGRTDTINVIEGQFNLEKLEQALGPDSGCTGDCVPFDAFGGAGSITQDMIDFVSVTGIDRGFTDQRVYAFDLGGPLFSIVDGYPVGLAFGYQYRRESGVDLPNPLTAAGEITGNKRDPVRGRFEVNSGYVELSVPLAAELPGIEFFEVNAAARYVDFNTFGTDVAYKFGLRWQVTPWLAARGTYSTAFRAPSINELFSGQADAFPSVGDPCSAIANIGSLENSTVAQNCAADGVGGGVPDTRTQLLARQGGNPDLDPETAVTYTAGFVLEESLVKGLSASLDYYNIEITDAIQSVGANVILTSCYESDPNERQFCELISRNQNGLITTITDIQNNVGGFNAEGLDFDVRYSANTEAGRFGGSFEGTYLLGLSQTQANGFEQSFLGNYDGGANPDYRLRSNLTWIYDVFNVGVNLRYIPGFVECETACEAERTGDAAAPPQRNIDQYFSMDVYAGVGFYTDWGETSVTAGMNNALDATPPFIVNGFLAESDASTYDYLGRYFYARLNQKF